MQMDPSAYKRRKLFAAIFILALIACIATGLIGPRLLAPAGSLVTMPEWLSLTSLAFGFVAVLTAPFAWRWLYRRDQQ